MGETSDPDSPERFYQKARASLDNGLDDGLITVADHERITEFLDAYDENNVVVPKPSDESHRKKRTLAAWCHRLRSAAKRIDGSLTEADADDVNQLWQDCLDGTHPDVKDEGLSKNTVSSHQSTVRMFYEYHDDLGVEREDLSVVAPEKTNVNEDEIFTIDEIYRMREATEHPRNRALFDLFVFTGQRLRAVQTLRVGDVDLEDGTFMLNEEAGGLKHADGKRPLLLAEASVRRWLNDGHPAPDDDDAYLLCQRRSYRADDAERSPLSQRTIRRVLKDIAERADVDKPSNPHNFRHSFVTIAKREYGLDNMTIKGLIGHKQGSRVMEETYAHLTDEDHIEAAQRATDTGHPDEDTSPTLDTCPACDEPLRDGAVACDMCGLQIAPSSRQAQELARDAVHETAKDAVTDQERAEVDEIRRLVEDNPELIAQALDAEALAEVLDSA